MKKVNAKSLVIALMMMGIVGCADKTENTDTASSAKAKEAPIKMELYIMSQCPFGVQAEDAVIPAVKKFNGEVDLSIEFIGTVDDAGEIFSMHGETELDGDTYQICARDIAPDKYQDFILCMNKNWHAIPENWESCAKETAIDAKALKDCKGGGKGKTLLKESFERSKKADAKGSPTIKINGEDYNGGRMSHDFVRYICDKYGEKNKIKTCLELPPPAKVKAIAISDKRCGEKCDPTQLFESLKQVFPGLEPETKYWEDPETQRLCKELGIKMLPALMFDKSIENDKDGANHMERWLVDTEKGYKLLKVKPEFDPEAEICDNGKDDTGNGKIDCDDESCLKTFTCRKEAKNTLELFIMSQCPYGVVAVKAMKEVLDAFGKDVTFSMHFIGENAEGKMNSLHGQAEIDEDMRHLCAAKKYPQNNKYLNYVWCRGKDIQNEDWKSCTGGSTGIDAAVIEKCVAENGNNMLAEEFALSTALGVNASPTFVVNGKQTFSAITAHSIQQNYCEKNKGLKGCEKKLSGSDEHNHGGEGVAPDAPSPSCGN